MITPDPMSTDSGRYSSVRTPTPLQMHNMSTDEAVVSVQMPKKPLRPEAYLPVQDHPVELVHKDANLSKCRICFILFEDNESKHDIMKHMKEHSDKVSDLYTLLIYKLDKWLSTGCRQTRVPWDSVSGAASYHFKWPSDLF